MPGSYNNSVKDNEQRKFVSLQTNQVAVATKSTIANSEGEVSVQNPLPADGDSVYVKDLDLDNCDNGNFTNSVVGREGDGTVADYFNDLKTINCDSTSNNPKSIKLWFKRTIYSHSIGFGCDDLTKNFGTSITVKLLGSGEEVRFTRTFTASNPNSFLAEFGPKAFNGIILEFNTVNEVCVSNLTIQKSVTTNSSIQGIDPNGDTQDVQVTEDGYLSINDNSSGLAIAKGDVTGYTFIHKFGSAPDFDQTDGEVYVWDAADDSQENLMTYTFSSTDDIDRLSSSDNSDTQQIEIQGLDVNYALVTQAITLTGQTPVALTTPLIRVFRLKNINSTDIAGRVYCFVNGTTTNGVPDVLTNIRAVIDDGNNQTEMAIYTVPAGKTAYMRDWYASSAGANKSTNILIKVRARPFGQVFQLKHKMAWAGEIPYKHNYTEPEKFTEKTDIIITAELTASGVTGGAVSAGFDLVLVDN